MNIEKAKELIDFIDNQEGELKKFIQKQKAERSGFNELLNSLSAIVECFRSVMNSDDNNWDRFDEYEDTVSLSHVEDNRLRVKVDGDHIIVDVNGDDPEDGYVNDPDNFHIVVHASALVMSLDELKDEILGIKKISDARNVELKALRDERKALRKGTITHEMVDRLNVVQARIGALEAIPNPSYPVWFEYFNSCD